MAQSDKDHGVEHAQLILETIDQLRKRKARPDKERICHMLQRRHGISLEATAADLERLVDAEVVVKVDYKGNTSYRNAAKWRKSHMGHVLNSNEVQGLIRQAVVTITGYEEGEKKPEVRPHTETEGAPPHSDSAPELTPAPAEISDAKVFEDDALAEKKLFINITPLEEIEQKPVIKQEGEGSLLAIKQEKGAAFIDIELWLRARDPTTALTGKQLFMALKREVDAGRLAKQPHDGTYVIGSGIPLPKKVSPAKMNKMTVKDLLSPDGEKFAPGDGKKLFNKDGSPREKVKKPPKKKARKSHGDESMGSGRAPSESSSISPHDGVTSTTGAGRGRKSMTSTSSRTPSPQMQPITIAPAMPVQLSPGGPYIVPMDGELRCDFCLLTAACNRNGRQEELLFCKDCQAKAHPSCMEYSEDLAARARNSPWQCIDCKTCYICEDSGDPDAMLFCDACDKGYHMDCHNPPVEEKPTGKWVCSKCVLELGVNSSQQMELDIDREVSRDSISTSTTDGPSCLPTPGNSPVPMQEGPPDQNANTVKTETYKHKDVKKILSPIPMMNGHINPPLPQLSETLPLEVPDASEWSIDDVVNYFLAVGFREQAEVFKEQEIDGKSLLLMKRSDVLTGLSLKLGPALKIYTHIQRLQTMGQNSHL